MLRLSKKMFARAGYGLFLSLMLFGIEAIPATSVLQQLEREVNQLVEIAKPSVVSISSKVTYSYFLSYENSSDPVFQDKGSKHSLSFRNVGTGIILDKEGYIATKSNVVQDALNIKVSTSNNETYDASFIGFDYETGLAIIQIQAKNLSPIKLGDSDTVSEGDWITIIGNSMGVLPSVSLGLINGIRTENNLFQLSAFINPGNSGSPVFNTRGEVIGLVAARLSTDNQVPNSIFSAPSSEGSIAYPINKIKTIATEIIQNKDKKKGWLGVTTDENWYSVSGQIKITHVIENGPAEKAGLMPNDIILEVNSLELQSAAELIKSVKNTKPDSIITLKILRNDEILPMQVAIGELPDTPNYFPPVFTIPQIDVYPQQSSIINTDNLEHMNTLKQRVQYLEAELVKIRGLLKQQ